MLPFSRLSEREREVVDLMVRGLVDKEICRELSITANTLRTYFRRIRDKLGDYTRSRLSAEYVAAGLLFELRDEQGHRLRTPEHHLQTQGWYKDVRAQKTYAGDAINLQLGLTPGEPHESSIYDSLLHPEDHEYVSRMITAVVLNGQTQFSMAHRCVLNGVVTSHYTFGEVEYEQGEPVVVRGHTVLVDSPTLLTQVAVGTWSLTSAGDHLSLDPECCRILAMTDRNELPLADFEHRVDPLDLETLRQFFHQVARPEQPGLRTSVRFLRAGFTPLHVQLYGRYDVQESRTVGSLIATI